MYFAGDPGNESDFLWNAIRDPKARESVTVAFGPATETNVAQGYFEIVARR